METVGQLLLGFVIGGGLAFAVVLILVVMFVMAWIARGSH